MDLVTAAIGIITLVMIYMYLTSNFNFFKERGIPGPRPFPLIGTLWHMMRYGLVKNDEIFKRKYGKHAGSFIGCSPSFMTFDIDVIKEVMITNSPAFQDHYVPFERKPPLGKMVTQLQGEDWRRVRNAITPIFTSGKLKRMVPLIFSSVGRLSEKFIQQAEAGEEADIKALFGRYTITVIADTMFGMKVTALDDPKDQFYVMSKRVMDISPRALFMLLFMVMPGVGKLLTYFNVEALDNEAIGFLSKGLEHAMKERKGREDEYSDFVSLLLKAEIPEEDAKGGARGLTTEEMLAQALIFMMAGYETTSAALTLTAYKLALHPEHQERCREEVLAEFRDDSPEQIYESLSRMPYLDACFNETLRLYPPAPRTDRVATKDVTLAGFSFPKDTVIAIPIRMMMRDPELWENPEEFYPDRFIAEDAGRSKLPFAFLPFGAGPRNCVGMRLARLKAKLAFADLLRKVRFVVSENTPAEPLEIGIQGIAGLKKPIVLKIEKL